jgi:iron complex outermembrane receptor protein
VNYLFFNPKIGATYSVDGNLNFYSLLAWTSREPRMSNLYSASDACYGATPLFEIRVDEQNNIFYDFSKPLIKPEKMLNFELGGNYRTEDFMLVANFYWMQYFDELVKSGQTDIFGEPIDGNAPKTLHYGLELEASYFLFKKDNNYLSINANATFSKNQIVEYNFVTDEGEIVPLKDNEVAGFPSIHCKYDANFQHNKFFVSVNGKFVGESRTDNFDDLILARRKNNQTINKRLYLWLLH